MAKKALIVYGGYEGHQPAKTSEIFHQELKNAGFDVVMSDTLDSFLELDYIRGFDLVVPNWTMGQFTGNQETNLVAAVESGVGLAGFHGGMGDAFRVFTTYQFMVGGQFVGHPDNHTDYEVNIIKKDDPIVAGLADFKVHSEQYYLHVDPSNEVLATTTFHTKSAPWVNGTIMPVVWKRMYGAGRVFYSSVGHDTSEFEIPEVREITKRGMIWAAR